MGDHNFADNVHKVTNALKEAWEERTFSGVDRNYRIKVPPNATGMGVFRRLVPYDTTERFPNQNHWAVDITSVDNVTTLRLVRTRVGSPSSTTAHSQCSPLPPLSPLPSNSDAYTALYTPTPVTWVNTSS